MQVLPIEPAKLTRTIITTTLFDLIETLNAGLDQDEDELVTATVMELIRAGRLTFVKDQGPTDTFETQSMVRRPSFVSG